MSRANRTGLKELTKRALLSLDGNAAWSANGEGGVVFVDLHNLSFTLGRVDLKGLLPNWARGVSPVDDVSA